MDLMIHLLSTPLGAQSVQLLARNPSDAVHASSQHIYCQGRIAARDEMQKLMERGVLKPVVDLDLLIDMVCAPLSLRLLIGEDVSDKSLPFRLADLAFRAMPEEKVKTCRA